VVFPVENPKAPNFSHKSSPLEPGTKLRESLYAKKGLETGARSNLLSSINGNTPCTHEWQKFGKFWFLKNYSRCVKCGLLRHDVDGDTFKKWSTKI
jgi:hypothetical protein